ncbi:unnamed protein product [Paramecium octaurelia]|uniref:Uncharacterized protein n=1 Tax=Paramecium octaurelia TaxID=43137 RepID=A0A8S1TTS7_PAROT|nr:unnamed protein product [Paramecium octaurelia]
MVPLYQRIEVLSKQIQQKFEINSLSNLIKFVHKQYQAEQTLQLELQTQESKLNQFFLIRFNQEQLLLSKLTVLVNFFEIRLKLKEKKIFSQLSNHHGEVFFFSLIPFMNSLTKILRRVLLNYKL